MCQLCDSCRPADAAALGVGSTRNRMSSKAGLAGTGGCLFTLPGRLSKATFKLRYTLAQLRTERNLTQNRLFLNILLPKENPRTSLEVPQDLHTLIAEAVGRADRVIKESKKLFPQGGRFHKASTLYLLRGTGRSALRKCGQYAPHDKPEGIGSFGTVSCRCCKSVVGILRH